MSDGKDSRQEMNDAQRPVALVTGGSRGVGAATTVALAERGLDVLLTYRNKAARAEQVVAAASHAPSEVRAIAADITGDDDRQRLFATIGEWRGRLDIVVLNASGGLERDLLAADLDYPMHINRDAQVALVEASLPLLARFATIVFVTSHWAHCYGQVIQSPLYEPVAASKHAGELALRAMIPTLAARDTRLLVVTGDLIEGTITAKLLERAERGFTDTRRDAIAQLPTTTDMAAAIVDAALDRTLPTGHTIVVGGPLDSLPGYE